MNDVNIPAPNEGEIPQFDGSEWVGVVPDLNLLSDVELDDWVGELDADQVLTFNGTIWVNQALTAGMLPAHTHVIGDTTGLQTALDGKADDAHTHLVQELGNFTNIGQQVGHVLRYVGGSLYAIQAIQAGDLPTGIDAANIGFGSTSNLEFSYINSLTSNAQDQLDAKADSAHSHALNDLSDVDTSGAASGEVVTYNGATFDLQPAAGGGGLTPVSRWSIGAGPDSMFTSANTNSGFGVSTVGFRQVSTGSTSGSTSHTHVRISNAAINSAELDVVYGLIYTPGSGFTEGDIFLGWVLSTGLVLGAAGITFTTNHVGITCEMRSSVETWYASNANGTSQTKTALTKGAGNEFASIVREAAAISFYHNGVLVATHTTNLPSNVEPTFAIGVSNRNTATNCVVNHGNASADYYHG